MGVSWVVVVGHGQLPTLPCRAQDTYHRPIGRLASYLGGSRQLGDLPLGGDSGSAPRRAGGARVAKVRSGFASECVRGTAR